MKIKSSHTLVSEAMEEIKTISPEEALDLIGDQKCNLIDIRDVRELEKNGRVENSQHIPRGMLEFWLDPSSAYYNEKKLGNVKNIVLYCALGFRSALATKALKEMGFKNVYNAEGGFDSLKSAGLEIVKKEKK